MTELQSFENWARSNYNFSRPGFLNPQVEPASVSEDISSSESKADFNTWTVKEWVQVPGVGEKLAQRIVENSPYNSLEDVGKVKGISERVLNNAKRMMSC